MIDARGMFREALKEAVKEAPTPGAAHRASRGARLSPASARLDPARHPPGEFAATAIRPRISGAALAGCQSHGCMTSARASSS
jgi:hypothetical protein